MSLVSDPASASLDQVRRDLGLSHDELWLRYFGLGGMSNALEVEGFLYGALVATAHDYNIVALALNERSAEVGADHSVAYREVTPPTRKIVDLL